MNYKNEILDIAHKTVINSTEAKQREIILKMRFADKYQECGFRDAITNGPLSQIDMDFFEGRKIQKIYETLLSTEDRFNILEIHFDLEMNAEAKYTWIQAYYDADIEGNKKLKKKK